MNAVPTITLNNGTEIPQLGFGVFQIPPEDTKRATLEALEVGYRHIDTAEMYGNEKGVGEAVAESGLAREDIFVTSKLNNGFHARADALAAFDKSLDDLGFEFLDLFLIHWPLPAVGDYVETWKAMEEMKASGRVEAIGVSNFQPAHLQRLFDETETVPAVNQIEVHPYLTQDDVRAFNIEHGIITEAWSPIAQGGVLGDPAIGAIAERLERTPAQVTLRWHIQRGDIIFPKSTTRSRIEENFAIFDFELTEADVAAIAALDRGERTGPNPDEFNYIPSVVADRSADVARSRPGSVRLRRLRGEALRGLLVVALARLSGVRLLVLLGVEVAALAHGHGDAVIRLGNRAVRAEAVARGVAHGNLLRWWPARDAADRFSGLPRLVARLKGDDRIRSGGPSRHPVAVIAVSETPGATEAGMKPWAER
jgi:2,5-diketo-D-gluconate reductase A